MRRNVAFTLAEVLITLGIIGIIAALTIPGLIEGYKKKVTVNKLKHSYSVLSNALLQAVQVHGDPTEWDWGNDNSYSSCKRMVCLLYTSPSPRDLSTSRMPSSA